MKSSRPFNRRILPAAVAIISLAMPVVALAQSLPPLNDNSGSGFQNYSNNNSAPPAQYGNGGYQNYGAPQDQNYGQPQQNYGQPQQQYGYNQPPLQGRVSTAPAGTFVTATFSQPVSSEFARVGDRFNATLGSPITGSDGSILLPAGSQLEAQVVMVKSAGHTGRNGELDVRFTSATLPNGQRIPLSARIQTQDGTGLITGGTNAGRIGRAALNTGIGAGLGAALGTAMGPLSGGHVGRGAIYGTAIGGGLGLAKAAWNKGKDAVLEAGQPVNVVLDQPLTVSPSGGNAPSNYGNYGGGYNYGGGSGGGY